MKIQGISNAELKQFKSDHGNIPILLKTILFESPQIDLIGLEPIYTKNKRLKYPRELY